jgi:hypothetical protein
MLLLGREPGPDPHQSALSVLDSGLSCLSLPEPLTNLEQVKCGVLSLRGCVTQQSTQGLAGDVRTVQEPLVGENCKAPGQDMVTPLLRGEGPGREGGVLVGDVNITRLHDE